MKQKPQQQQQRKHNMEGNLIDLELVREMCVAACAAHVPGQQQQTVFVPPEFVEKKIPAEHEIALPGHIRQRLTLLDRESFTTYVKKYKGASSQIFATVTQKGAHFVGVIDYHESGNERTPNHLRHVAEFAPKYSDDFEAWLLINGKALSQEDFLNHLRRWGATITSHTDADLIEISSNLEFKSAGQFSSKVERTTGGRKLTFNETIEGSTNTKAELVPVPDGIAMKSPIFQGGKEFEYSADLLYRINGGRLSITVELKRPHVVIKAAIDSLIEDIVAETEIQPLIGTVVLPS